MTVRMPDPYRHMVASGHYYTVSHKTGDTIGDSIMAAIGRLIDKQELDWDIRTDALTLTDRGETEAKRTDWWWRNG